MKGSRTRQKEEWLEAADRALSADWGLDDEDRGTDSLSVARFWVAVYEQLLAFDEQLYEVISEQIKRLPVVAMVEVRATKMLLVEAQLERIRTRLAFWQTRERELALRRPRRSRLNSAKPAESGRKRAMRLTRAGAASTRRSA